MSPISIPYHLIVPGIICILLLLLIVQKRKALFKKYKWFWISVVVFLCTYGFIVLYCAYLSLHYRWNLNQYDLNGNGFFERVEMTTEQQKASLRLARDTARNLSFITGLILALIIAASTYLFGQIVERIKK